jgi:hypothetical protein
MTKKKKRRKIGEKQTSRGTQFRRFIETFSLAVTFLACSLTLIYVIYIGNLVSALKILFILIAAVSFLIFLFFTVALCKTKLIKYYDQIFEPSLKWRWYLSVISGIFVGFLFLAIEIGLISGLAPLFNEMSERWWLLKAITAICIIGLPIYVSIVLLVNPSIGILRRRK